MTPGWTSTSKEWGDPHHQAMRSVGGQDDVWLGEAGRGGGIHTLYDMILYMIFDMYIYIMIYIHNIIQYTIIQY